VNVKRFITEIREDKLVSRSLAAGVALFVLVAALLWHPVMVDGRTQALDRHFGLSMKIVASRIDAYLDDYYQQLTKLAEQSNLAQDFATDDSSALDSHARRAVATLTDAESVRYVNSDLKRHPNSLSLAAKEIITLSLGDSVVTTRAIKADGQWKLLISKPILPSQKPDAQPIGVILVTLPINGLRLAVSSVEIINGSLQLKQEVTANSSATLLTIGDPLASKAQRRGIKTTLLDTVNPLWKITVWPTSSLIRKIDASLPPFWLLLASANMVLLLCVYLLASVRVNRRSLITDIFIEEHNAKDALFARPSDDDLILNDTNQHEEPQTEIQEPSLEIEEPQLEAAESQPEIEEPKLETEQPQTETHEPQLEAAESQPDTEEPKLETEKPQPNLIGSLPQPFVLPDVVFRDYDIRGIADIEINPEFASRLGKTIGTIILQNGHTAIYIGRDGRLSSPLLAQALEAGLLSTGCNVINLGEITTPMLNFAVHYCGQSSCGIMVTASHNAAVYNGFKIIIQRQVISGKALQLLKPMLLAEKFKTSDDGLSFSRDINSQYIRHIVENSTIDRPFRLVVDAGNSVAGPAALKLFDNLGCAVFPINCEIDGSFPNHEPNPADEKNLKQIISKVKEVKADLGLAFDGDGDRLVAISGKGQIIWPDQLMMIFARDILKDNPGGDIVFDVKSSKRLAEIIRANSGRPVMCKTGHSHVRKAVSHSKALLGGEFSGHIFFNDRWKGFDDGLYAATRLLEVLCSQRNSGEKTLDQIIGSFKISSFTAEILVPAPDDKKFEIIQTLLSGCQFDGAQIISLDGLRAEYPYGWGLIRASNTSANLTLRFEADDDAGLEKVKHAFRRELAPFINQIEDFI
jgi:phosphomannomutase / phosphoglucomutase